MKENYITLASLFCSLGFLSCIDESAPVATATVDATSRVEVFGGYTLELNPTIVFSADGKSGTYDNTANLSGYPAGQGIWQTSLTWTEESAWTLSSRPMRSRTGAL